MPPPCLSDLTITGNYTQTLTESDTWIKGDAVLTFDPSTAVTLEADSINGYIEFAPVSNTDYMVAEPLSSGTMLATMTDGCSPLKPSRELNELNNTEKTIVYPNPFSSSMVLKNKNWSDDQIQWSITSIEGKRWMHARTQSRGDQIELDLSALPIGMYLLNVQDGQEKAVMKIMKER